jgi:hypothetical protein
MVVHEFPGWTDELRSLQVPTLLIFGDRDFSPLPDVVEMFEFLPDGQLAVLPGTTHVGVTRRPGEVLALITLFLDAQAGRRLSSSGTSERRLAQFPGDDPALAQRLAIPAR